ncbi:MAG TPA: hypothetical protein VFZ64_02205 [Nocardioidaceae bacterium]
MRSFLSGVALLLATATATVALLAYTAHETVLEPRRAGELLAGALDTAEVRDTVLARAVPGYAVLPAQHRESLNRMARSDRVGQVLGGVEVDGSGRVDLTPVRRELVGQLEDGGHTGLAGRVRNADGEASLRIPRRYWDMYAQARGTAWTTATLGGLAAGVLFAAAVLLARSRRLGLLGAGVGVLLSAAAAAVAFRLLPEVAPLVAGDPRLAELAEIGALPLPVVVPVLLPAAVVGAVLVLTSLAVPARRQA